MKYIITEKQLENLNKKTPINESVLKISKLMYYDSEKTATENKEIVEEQYAGWSGMMDARANAKRQEDRWKSDGKSKAVSTDKIYTDHDRVWDYKIENNQWYTRRKGSTGGWISLAKYPAAIQKLNKKYGTSVQA